MSWGLMETGPPIPREIQADAVAQTTVPERINNAKETTAEKHGWDNLSHNMTSLFYINEIGSVESISVR